MRSQFKSSPWEVALINMSEVVARMAKLTQTALMDKIKGPLDEARQQQSAQRMK
jgi:hypothetical protein